MRKFLGMLDIFSVFVGVFVFMLVDVIASVLGFLFKKAFALRKSQREDK